VTLNITSRNTDILWIVEQTGLDWSNQD